LINGEAGGHKFENGRCRCGIFWVDIRNVTYDDIGQDGIAHVGALNHSEVTSIMQLRSREDEFIAMASGWR
jgi:hypothetical protein